MNEPTFKSFEKASMFPSNLPSSTNNYIVPYNVNKEETNISPLCVSRVPQNFGKHIYIIYSSDINNINRCLTYIQRLTNLTVEGSEIDTSGEFNQQYYKKGVIYQFNMLKNDIKNPQSKDSLGFMLEKIIDNSEGIILINDNKETTHPLLTTMSHLVFIDKNIKMVEDIVKECSGLNIDNYNYNFEKMLCVNKTTLWSKLSTF